MHDHLTDQPERHRLYPEGEQQHAQEQQRTVGNPLTGEPLHEQHQQDERPGRGERAPQQAEEPQRLVGEPEQEQHAQHVDQAPHVGPRPVHPRPGVPRVLRHLHFLHVPTLLQRQQGQEARRVPVDRQLGEHLRSEGAHAARDIVELPAPARQTRDQPVEDSRLDSVHGRVPARPSAGHGHVRPRPHPVDQLRQPFGVHPVVGRQGDQDVPAGVGDGQLQERGLLEGLAELQHPDRLALVDQRIQLLAQLAAPRRHQEEELERLSPGLERRGVLLVQRPKGLRPLGHRHGHRDRDAVPILGPGGAPLHRRRGAYRPAREIAESCLGLVHGEAFRSRATGRSWERDSHFSRNAISPISPSSSR